MFLTGKLKFHVVMTTVLNKIMANIFEEKCTSCYAMKIGNIKFEFENHATFAVNYFVSSSNIREFVQYSF